MLSPQCTKCGAVSDSVVPSGVCDTCRAASGPTQRINDDSSTVERPGDQTQTAPLGLAGFGVMPPGGYDFGDWLGGGGMGDVYEAVQPATGQQVVVKKLRPEFCTPTGLGRFLVEARILASVGHDGVVRLLNFVPDPADPLLVMERVPGEPLSRRIAPGKPLPPEAAARYVAEAARAVQAAHDANALHRDLKPGNLMVTPADRIKVLDFGLGKRTDADDDLTRTGYSAGGTPGFMAPEQVDDKMGEPGPAADVWGLGATLYAAAVGEPPFPGGKANVFRVLADPLVPPRARNKAVPPVLDAIICRCLEKDPAKRYPTAAAVADDLERFLRGESTVAKPLPWHTKVWRRVRRIPRAVAAAWAVAGVVAIGGGVALAMIPKPEPVVVQQPTRTPEDELADMQERFDAGEEVVIVGEKGLPKWYEWVVGKSDIAESPLRDGSAHIEPIGTAAVKLFSPTTDSYEVSVELRHMSAKDVKNDATSRVGFMLFHGRNGGSDGIGVDSFTTVDYHDWGFGKPPNSQKVAVTGRHTFFSTTGDAPAPSTNRLNSAITTFTADTLPAKWRRLKAEVTPNGCRLFWCDDATDPKAETRQVAEYTTAQLNHHAAEHRRVIGLLPQAMEMNPGLVPAAWNPRGGFGVWTSQSGLCFRNVTVRALPLKESP